VRFFQNGVADLHLRVASSGDAIALCNSSDTEIYRFNTTNGIFDLYGGKVRLQDGGSIEFLNSGTTIKWLTGVGTPEGVITAAQGSMYTNRSGGTSTTLYVKETGTGNTGWVAK
jgi:hypothetical protein